ncbi:hypothetical protein MATL_G00114770 [Megalops atlanticus]|uniref:Secreted protein n=1 Tax=Megalops atlanticus TaxID=7932 RepID=A0A9D3PZR2_MEGAT|nr:hypothetical protein MATL_G00114770 [Megalops atlanticus]
MSPRVLWLMESVLLVPVESQTHTPNHWDVKTHAGGGGSTGRNAGLFNSILSGLKKQRRPKRKRDDGKKGIATDRDE